jgi:hypothetical protein
MRGWITAADRWGQVRDFPLMTCSAAILPVRPEDDYGCVEDLGRAIASMKKEAKASETGIVLGAWARERSHAAKAAHRPAPRRQGSEDWLSSLLEEHDGEANRICPVAASEASDALS